MPYSRELGGPFTELISVYLSKGKINNFYLKFRYSSWNLIVRL